MLAEDVVQAAFLRRALDAACADLLDLDVRDGAAAGFGGRRGRRVEVLDVEGECGRADGFAGQPADSLEGEHRVKGAGLRLVLWEGNMFVSLGAKVVARRWAV